MQQTSQRIVSNHSLNGSKTQARSRRGGATLRSKSAVKSETISDSGEQCVTLQFQSPDGNEICTADIPTTVFSSVERNAKAAGISVSEFVSRSLELQLASLESVVAASGLLIPLSEDERKAIEQAHDKVVHESPPNDLPTMQEWIKGAILREAKREMFNIYPVHRLEDSVNECIALLHILVNRCEVLQGDDVAEDRFTTGLAVMAYDASERLERCFNSVFDFTNGKPMGTHQPCLESE